MEYTFITQRPEFGNNNEERFIYNDVGREFFIQFCSSRHIHN
jgi:hypothetical protein